MVSGLQKSAPQCYAEQLKTHVNALKKLDDRGLGGVALYCSYIRLTALSNIYKRVPSESYPEIVKLYYRPLVVPISTVQSAVKKLDESRLKSESYERQFARNLFAQGYFGLIGTAEQTWRNTWLACLHSDIRYLCQEMWGIICLGFPFVEEVAGMFIEAPDFKASAREITLFEAAMRNDGDGSDYSKIPQGFEPLVRQCDTDPSSLLS